MDLLSEILTQLRLRGTLYFRTSFTSPWGVKVPPYKHVARFHLAHKGRCLVRIEGTDSPVALNQGDLVIIPKGAAHTLYCDPTTEQDALPLETVISASGFTGQGALVYGEPGTHHETQLVCGHFEFDEGSGHPLIAALPGSVHIANYGETAGAFMESTLKVIGAETAASGMGSDLIALKLSEIIFAQAMRSFIQNEGTAYPGLAGFADPRISRALSALHHDPGRAWSIEQMADTSGMSRTAFISRFSETLNMTPMAYLTMWRLQLARRALEAGTDPIIDIAERIGYHSEAAFGRAFKKQHGIPPATYRRQHLAR